VDEDLKMQHPFINIASQAARNASKIILQFMDRLDVIKIHEKDLNEIVIEIDLLSEQEIIKQIRKSYPEHSILSEESGFVQGKKPYCWIIDPLDGSMNYVHSFPHFAISIAVKHDNHIEAGIVYDPIRQELFTATRGGGAYLNNRRIRVSNCKKLSSALIGTGFPVKKKQHIKPYLNTFQAIFQEVSGIRRAGSASLDLAYVAAGRLDGFWEASLNEWDMAAGTLLIQEAGGIVTDLQGSDQYLFAGNIIAGSPKVHNALESTIQNCLKE